MFYFTSRLYNLTVVLKPSTKTLIGGEVVRVPGAKAEFKGGLFYTEDENVAKMLRAVKDPHVSEITEEDRASFKATARGPKAIRGPLTAEGARKPGDTPASMAEMNKKRPCPICDEVFKTQQSLDIHLVGHRASVKPAVAMQEKPADK